MVPFHTETYIPNDINYINALNAKLNDFRINNNHGSSI